MDVLLCPSGAFVATQGSQNTSCQLFHLKMVFFHSSPAQCFALIQLQFHDLHHFPRPSASPAKGRSLRVPIAEPIFVSQKGKGPRWRERAEGLSLLFVQQQYFGRSGTSAAVSAAGAGAHAAPHSPLSSITPWPAVRRLRGAALAVGLDGPGALQQWKDSSGSYGTRGEPPGRDGTSTLLSEGMGRGFISPTGLKAPWGGTCGCRPAWLPCCCCTPAWYQSLLHGQRVSLLAWGTCSYIWPAGFFCVLKGGRKSGPFSRSKTKANPNWLLE